MPHSLSTGLFFFNLLQSVSYNLADFTITASYDIYSRNSNIACSYSINSIYFAVSPVILRGYNNSIVRFLCKFNLDGMTLTNRSYIQISLSINLREDISAVKRRRCYKIVKSRHNKNFKHITVSYINAGHSRAVQPYNSILFIVDSSNQVSVLTYN